MLSQDQRSVTDQLNDLVTLANKHGLYDAADWLKSTLRQNQYQSTPSDPTPQGVQTALKPIS
jgi:hypothetical protein